MGPALDELETELQQGQSWLNANRQIPLESQIKYIKEGLVHENYVLVEISKGIDGLAQAGILAQNQLFDHLAANDFYPISPEHPCIFKHKTKNITF